MPGTHKLTAVFEANEFLNRSVSDTKRLTIAADPTTTTLTLAKAKVQVGHEHSEKLSVRVKPKFASRAPTGKVTIKTGSTTVCVITLKKAVGNCLLKASQLKPGIYPLVATYPGVSPYAKAPAVTKTLTVTK
jgi:hypothetical protein